VACERCLLKALSCFQPTSGTQAKSCERCRADKKGCSFSLRKKKSAVDNEEEEEAEVLSQTIPRTTTLKAPLPPSPSHSPSQETYRDSSQESSSRGAALPPSQPFSRLGLNDLDSTRSRNFVLLHIASLELLTLKLLRLHGLDIPQEMINAAERRIRVHQTIADRFPNVSSSGQPLAPIQGILAVLLSHPDHQNARRQSQQRWGDNAMDVDQ